MTIYFNEYEYRKTRNIIDNPSFNIQQRGAGPFTSPAYTADRWYFWYGGGTHRFDIGNYGTVYPGNAVSNGIVTATSQQLTYDTMGGACLLQVMEGYNILPLIGKQATLSFWVYATVPGIYSVSLRDQGYTNSFIREYVVNDANNWEYKTVNISFDNPNITWEKTHNRAGDIVFTFATGTGHATSTVGQWVSGNYIASSNQVNYSQAAGNVVAITEVQLEEGLIATPFEYISISTELSRCLRYYEKKYHIAPATGVSTGTGTAYFVIEYVKKRIVPVVFNFISPSMYRRSGLPWRDTTSVLYHTGAAYHDRALCIFYDTANSDYVQGESLLIQSTFEISGDL